MPGFELYRFCYKFWKSIRSIEKRLRRLRLNEVAKYLHKTDNCVDPYFCDKLKLLDEAMSNVTNLEIMYH